MSSQKETVEITQIIQDIFDQGIDIKEFVNALDDSDIELFSKAIFDRQTEKINSKIDPLPELANNEFKVFDDRAVEKVTDKVIEIRKRRYVAFIYYYANFNRTDDQVVEFIRHCNPGLSYVQAVRDLTSIKNFMNNSVRVRRELIRYQVIQIHLRAAQIAEARNDAIGMAAAANGMTKAAQLDKDITEIPWEQLNPPLLEPTDNLEALGEGFEKRTNIEAEIAKMKKKYGDVEDVDYE